MFDRERPSFEDSNNVTVKRCFFAYELAKKELNEKVVADIGCADGYGTHYLAGAAKNIVGIDYSEETINQARKNHGHITNLTFKSGKVPPIPLADNSLDVLTAFQFIEHIELRKEFMQEVFRVLKKGGLFICTTPNRKMSIARNPFHVFEYTFDEMKAEANEIFDKVDLWGVQGNEKVNKYYTDNAAWAKKILRLDPLKIHQLIPAKWLIAPYNFLTSLMRKNLKEQNVDTLTIETTDFFITQENLDKTWDILLFAHKS